MHHDYGGALTVRFRVSVTGMVLLQNCCVVKIFGRAVYIMNRRCGEAISEVQFVIRGYEVLRNPFPISRTGLFR